jgi:hypothetical protein
MLPFNSDRQAKRVRQDAGLTEGAWKSRQQAIRAEHRAEGARPALAQACKERLKSKGGGAAAAGPAKSAGMALPDGELQFDEDD